MRQGLVLTVSSLPCLCHHLFFLGPFHFPHHHRKFVIDAEHFLYPSQASRLQLPLQGRLWTEAFLHGRHLEKENMNQIPLINGWGSIWSTKILMQAVKMKISTHGFTQLILLTIYLNTPSFYVLRLMEELSLNLNWYVPLDGYPDNLASLFSF